MPLIDTATGLIPGRSRVFQGGHVPRRRDTGGDDGTGDDDGDADASDGNGERKPKTSYHNTTLSETLSVACIDALSESAPAIFDEVTDAEFSRYHLKLERAIANTLRKNGVQQRSTGKRQQ